MRLNPFPRRQRILWLVAIVLRVYACGAWLAATGRTPGYGSQFDSTPAAEEPAAHSIDGLMSRVVQHEAAQEGPGPASITGPAPAPVSQSAEIPPAGFTTGRDAVDFGLAGMTDPLTFASAVADTVFTSRANVAFGVRVEAVMAVAALPPLGSPTDLHADLLAFAPDAGLGSSGAAISFSADSVAVSPWGSARISQLHLPVGAFAIDVTGHQLIDVPGHDPVSVTVTVGMTGACPPALMQCELDRIFPRTVAAELEQ
jgi:hypothetical protein